jgi:hypothetical protein
MCSISVIPMPSRMSTPKWRVQRSYSGAGSASPADAASRTPRSASPGTSMRSIAAKNVGPPKNSVAPYSPARAAIVSGRDGAGSRTALAPTDSGNRIELPKPYAKKPFAADSARSDGRMPSTCVPYVSQTTLIEPCRCIAPLGRPVVPEV